MIIKVRWLSEADEEAEVGFIAEAMPLSLVGTTASVEVVREVGRMLETEVMKDETWIMFVMLEKVGG